MNWIKFTKSYIDLATAGLTNSVALYNLPAGAMIHGCMIKHTDSFTGGAIATYVVKVGVDGTLGKYAADFDVFQDVSNTAFSPQATIGALVYGSENWGAVKGIKVTATSTVANLDQASSGSVNIYLLVSQPKI